ncbi:MORN repeat protein, partial [Opisthorchis viverrini]
MRQGLGVRRSAPYALASEFNRAVRAAQSQNSIPSGTDSERGWRGTGSIGGGSGGDVRTGERGRPDERRSGFVLRSTSCPSPASQPGFRSASRGPEKRSIFKRGLFRKLRKQKSTGDLSTIGGQTIGGFSSTSGCGGGGLFQNRRRGGGSLRSTLSGSSQLTTNSFSRNEMKGLGNGGQGLHEFMDEPVGPNVTETYSGQWNADRRSGYGVAERSDGLKYAGEWFNNKKDGYGVTYFQDGTKEEGKYKENLLVQALNRRSKLFLLRHTKLRDAIEEAVKNAQDASKKAQETASEAAYQRAQTARMVANTADARARDARKLSDQARSVAREFSPEFVQLGQQWEKQNPLLKKELFGVSKDVTDAANANRQPQHNLRAEGLLNGEGMTGNSLEVSGGSRQGSFRSSFRRHGANTHEPRSREIGQQNTDRQRYPNDFPPDMNNADNGLWPYKQSLQSGPGSMGQMGPNSQDPYSNFGNMTGRTPGGRPIARAATTGVTGIGYSSAEQRQMVQHMAQHPHSPYLMSSVSQQLDELTDAQTAYNYNTMPPGKPQPRIGANTQDGATFGGPQRERTAIANAQLSVAQEHKAKEIHMAEAQLVQPSEVHCASVGVVELNQYAKTTDSQSGDRSENAESGEHSSRVSEVMEIPFIQPIEPVPHVRRRTLPSIMTEPPVHPEKSGRNKWPKKPAAPVNKITDNRCRTPASRFGEDAVHSAENLPAHAADTYIIENGIRKRVQAVTQQNPRVPLAHRLPEDEEREGRRPEWTIAYDPYRPAMESTVVVSHLGPPPQYSEQNSGSVEPPLLPRTYRIESEISLLGATKEASMPDLPSACHSAVSGHGRGNTRQVGLTREELNRLTHARRLELMEEMERRKRGEIVIRLADIKDWIRSNFVIVFVLLINASLAFLFFNLLTGSTDTRSVPSAAQNRLTRAQSSPPTPNTAGTVQLAKKVISNAIKKAKLNGNRDEPSGSG